MAYEPAEDSFLLLKHLKAHCRGKSVLDMGTGFGILAETALENGASRVLAVDINPEQIKYVQQKGIPALVSDLFENVEGSFDVIVFNPPYLPEDEIEDEETKRIVSGGKHGHEIIEKFLVQAKKHLNEQGEILFVFSSLTNKKKIDVILKRLKYTFTCLDMEKHFYETLYSFTPGSFRSDFLLGDPHGVCCKNEHSAVDCLAFIFARGPVVYRLRYGICHGRSCR